MQTDAQPGARHGPWTDPLKEDLQECLGARVDACAYDRQHVGLHFGGEKKQRNMFALHVPDPFKKMVGMVYVGMHVVLYCMQCRPLPVVRGRIELEGR